MGLDVVFRARSKFDPRYSTEVGYFGKVNFILTYFNISNDMNCTSIEVSHEQLHAFVNDLHKELIQHKANKTCSPVSQKFVTKQVFFGGSTEYDNTYWEDMVSVYNWAKRIDTDHTFDWVKDNLEMFISWWGKQHDKRKRFNKRIQQP